MNVHAILGMEKDDLTYALVALVAVCAFFVGSFRLSGLFFFLTLLVLFVAPTFLLLGAFSFPFWERLILGAFAGFGLLPSVVYYSGLALNSLRSGVLVYLVLCLLVLVVFRKRFFDVRHDASADHHRDGRKHESQ